MIEDALGRRGRRRRAPAGRSGSGAAGGVAPQHPVHEVRGDVPRLGARAEARVEPELERELVVDARTAEEQDDLAPPALALEELDERAPVLLVAVALGDDLAHQDGVGAAPRARARRALVLDLRAEVVHLEAPCSSRAPCRPRTPCS